MHETKFRWALEAIKEGRRPYGLEPEKLAAEVLASADTLDAELEHRLHHIRPHPNGGTWPYAKPVCECNRYDHVGMTTRITPEVTPDWCG